jgi:hypothetical protein
MRHGNRFSTAETLRRRVFGIVLGDGRCFRWWSWVAEGAEGTCVGTAGVARTELMTPLLEVGKLKHALRRTT